MEKQFTYRDQAMIAYWNGKNYSGTRYIEIKNAADRFGHGTRMTWNDERGWTKNGGMPYAQTVADLFGLK
jgi:hypothetical protein